MPFLRILNKLRTSIDKHKHAEKKLSYLKDSMIVTQTDFSEDDHQNQLLKNPTSHVLHTTHKLTQNDHDFDGYNWIRSDDGKWKPPPEPPDQKPIITHESDNIASQINKSKATPHIQNDSGANRIVTDNMSSLRNVQVIEPIPMGGCNKHDEAAITCTAIGQLPIRTTDGQEILTKAYYSAEVDGTIISPTAMVKQHIKSYHAWLKYADCDNKEGTLKLIGRDNVPTLCFKIYCHNDLWYHDQTSVGNESSPSINHISNAAKYELWHQRTAHAGTNTLESLHKHVKGVPALKGNAFYRCPSCMSGKLCTKRSIGKPTTSKGATISQQHKIPTQPKQAMPTNSEPLLPGQHFAMDFGFVRGSDFHHKTKDGNTVTSIDGMNSYLSIIDRATRYMWVFTTKSKKPPLDAVKMILSKFKSSHPHRTVRTDQGGELGKSSSFATMIADNEFSLELTGADASAQNGIVENPNKTFGQMMRCLLHSSELGPEYWTYALQHAVYIRNRLPHHSTGTTPYESLTGMQPDLSGLRIFGSRLYARKPGKRTAKLDTNTYKGYFIGFTATDKNIIYIDEDTGRIKTGTHVIFDEAHMSVPAANAPLAAQTLQRLGYYSKEDWVKESFAADEQDKFLVQHLTTNAITPTRGTKDSIGYDLHLNADQNIIIPAGTIMPLPTGIAIKCPSGTYARIAPRSGLTIKNHLTTLAGVIDPDYRGDVTVLLQNFGETHQIIKPGQRIAQLILKHASVPPINVVNTLVPTERGKDGFGSTDQTATKTIHIPITTVPKLPSVPNMQPAPLSNISPNTAAAAKLFSDIQTTFERPYNIHLSDDPYDNHTSRMIDIKATDDDAFYGLNIISCPDRNIPMLIDCKPGTSAIRIPKWRSQLRRAYITHINGEQTNSIDDIRSIFNKIRNQKQHQFKIGFSTIEKQAMHPQLGVPQLYHDQMNIIGKHLWDIAHDPLWTERDRQEIAFPITPRRASKVTRLIRHKLGKDKYWSLIKQLPSWYKLATIKKSRRKKLTRHFLQQQDDWTDWQQSEFKQLNQYESQKTFGLPCNLPKDANLLPLLWTYMIKDCGTKKARCVCNGSSKMKGTVTLGDTYAGSLEQTGSRIFWSATALYNFVTIGADASNAFAEASAPKAPLFVSIDRQFHEWYKEKYPNKPPIPHHFVLPVQGALQGHPESARL